MEKITTNLDQHGRILIPAQIRERFNIELGDKVVLEMKGDALKILNVNHIVDEMHNIFTKNQNVKKGSMVDEFIGDKRREFKIEESRGTKNE